MKYILVLLLVACAPSTVPLTNTEMVPHVQKLKINIKNSDSVNVHIETTVIKPDSVY